MKYMATQQNMTHQKGRVLVGILRLFLFAAMAFLAGNPTSAEAAVCANVRAGNLTFSEVTLNSSGNAQVTITNNTTNCSYNVALTSYKTGNLLPAGQEAEYIRNQQPYRSDFRQGVAKLKPGQSVTLVVAVPNCNWQVDAFEYSDGASVTPTPPDFAALETAGTHRLFKWKQRFDAGTCFAPQLAVSCTGTPNPAQIGQNVTWTANPIGGTGNYVYSWTGNGSFPPGAITRNVTAVYNSAGIKNANVTVTSGTQTATVQCTIQVSEPPTQPTCDARRDLSASEVTINAAGKAEATVTNRSTSCSYNLALVSYKVGAPTTDRNEFLRNQELFSSQTRSGLQKLTPGQSTKLEVAIPSCNYQVDLFEFENGADPTPLAIDLDRLHGTVYELLKWKVDQTRGTCFPVIVQCPSKPTITSVSNASGKVGIPFSYTITWSGGVEPVAITTSGQLPAGLTRNGNVISGTPTAAGTFSYTISAKSNVSDTTCKDVKTITITITPPNVVCVAPSITSALSATGQVGQVFSYTIVTSGGTAPVSISTTQLPAGLTLNGNVISGTPTEAGTAVVAITARGGEDDPTCKTVRNLTITTTGIGICVSPVLTGQTTILGKVGTAFSHTITFTGGNGTVLLSATNLPPGLSFSENTISGTPTQAGTFDAAITAVNTAPNGLTCSAMRPIQIVISTTNPGCTVGCGGLDQPNVYLSGIRKPGENPLAFVYLSQLPYTGVTSNIKIALFVLALLFWSVVIAVLLVSKGARNKLKAIFSRSPRSSETEDIYSAAAAAVGNSYTKNHIVQPAHVPPTASPAMPVMASTQEPQEGSEDRFTIRASKTQNGTTANDDNILAASLSRQAALMKEEPQKRSEEKKTELLQMNAQIAPDSVLKQTLETKAKQENALISDYGLNLIIIAANGKEENALRILNQLLTVAKSWYPTEGGWLVLNQDKIQKVLFSTYITMVPIFIQWVAESNSKKVFSFLRMLRSQEHSVKEFIKNVIYELDNVYRFRIERGYEEAEADEHSIQSTSHWTNEDIEKVIATLIGAVDEGYKASYMPVKLALLKIMELGKKKRAIMSRPQGMHYVNA